MYAIIETGGKQYKVSAGDTIFIEKLDVEADSEDEAIERATDGNTVYEEEEPTEASEVDEFFVEL